MEGRRIISMLEKISPTKYALSWDNVGLLVGTEEKEINRIMFALDANDSVIAQAIQHKVDLLVTHHPLIFSPMKRVNSHDFIGRRVLKLIENNITCYAMHTNFDVTVMASESANLLGLEKQQVLEVTNTEKLYKIVVFVPVESETKVRNAMTAKGAGYIGNYSECTFMARGQGTYRPLEGTHPYNGTLNELSIANEVRLETIIGETKLNDVIVAMLKVHPYEEVAYDIYEVKNEGNQKGIGRVGYLPKKTPLKQLVEQTKECFGIPHLRVTGDLDRMVDRIAICPGSGSKMIEKALSTKAEVLISGDMDYHTVMDAKAQGLAVIDAGHFETEHFMVNTLQRLLKSYMTIEEESKIQFFTAMEDSPFHIV